MRKILLVFLFLSSCVANSNPIPIVPDLYQPSTTQQPAQNTHISESVCPNDMVLVEGEYCPNVQVDCAEWAQYRNEHGQFVESHLRCLRFARPAQCLSSRRIHMRYCMDRFEWPNEQGRNPVVMVTWFEANRLCRMVNKRLCTTNEFSFAQYGPDMNPYPYGDHYTRDSNACHIDHIRHYMNHARLANPTTMEDELRLSYEAEPAGSRETCRSWAGVYDIVGNVDEWTEYPRGNMDHPPYRSALMSGWWGPVRNRSGAVTLVHGPSFSYYNIGLRCCLSTGNN